MTIYPNNSKFYLRAYDYLSHELFTRFTVPNLKFFPVEQALQEITEWLVSLVTPMPLLHQQHLLPTRLVLQQSGCSVERDHWCLLSPNSSHSNFQHSESLPKERSLPRKLTLISLCSTAKVYGIFSKRVTACHDGWQPTTVVIAYVVWHISG